jgi:hypothetical protein
MRFEKGLVWQCLDLAKRIEEDAAVALNLA